MRVPGFQVIDNQAQAFALRWQAVRGCAKYVVAFRGRELPFFVEIEVEHSVRLDPAVRIK
jgi:hypothetical protein